MGGNKVKRYDCYQINLQVNLSEEDSCLYNRYGLSLFNIKKIETGKCIEYSCDEKSDDKCCHRKSCNDKNKTVNTNVTNATTPTVSTVTTVTPDISTPVTVCENNDTCNNDCIINDDDNKENNSTDSDSTDSNENSYSENSENSENSDKNSDDNSDEYTNDCNVSECDDECAYVNDCFKSKKPTIPDASIICIELDRCDNTKAIFTLFVRLSRKKTCNKKSQRLFENEKFMLTSGGSGHEKEIVTFVVNPLPANVSASGVFNKCYTFEITRVPCRKFKHCNNDCCKNKYNESDACSPELTFIGGDTLQIMFPLTKEIKCLTPDVGLSGTLLNITLGTLIKSKVRIVSNGPIKFFIPALLSYDKETCMVCLEISTRLLRDGVKGYEHMFGTFGCVIGDNCLVPNCQCDAEGSRIITDIINDDSPTAFSKFFNLLASSKKLDVMGVDKCVEKILFNFQVCYVPFKNIVVDNCGTKINTDPCISCLVFGFPTFSNSFKVMADSIDYTYELSYSCACKYKVECCNESH